MNWHETFLACADRKSREADAASLSHLETTQANDAWKHAPGIGNSWTRAYYDGDFALSPEPDDRPAVSLVFVQSRDGNTGAHNPDDLGGGPTDKHLIYEGLSRVAADAVLAGASTIGKTVFFSVWRRELVDLRQQLGRARHPTQMVVSRHGRLDLPQTLLFNVPEVPVILLAGEECRLRCADELQLRPWIRVIPFEDDWQAALARVRYEHGIHRISAIGGRHTATSLLDADMVQDLCLTTTSRAGGEPGTPFYVGMHQPKLDLIVKKRERAQPASIEFEHFAVTAATGAFTASSRGR